MENRHVFITGMMEEYHSLQQLFTLFHQNLNDRYSADSPGKHIVLVHKIIACIAR